LNEGSDLARSLGELAAAFGCELAGDPAVEVNRVATLANAGGDCLSFFANTLYRDDLRATGAAAVIVREEDVDDCPVAALIAADPYLAYARMAALLHPDPELQPGIHDRAWVSENADIAATAEVSANVSIADNVLIGDGVYVGPGAVIGPRCHIGDGTRILANATLVQDVKMGQRCLVHPGAVIGADGFGNAQSSDGWVKVPQVGGVRVGDDAEIGANSTIDRGAIDDTVIGNGVRIDNLVQIAHNVQVGDHTAMAAYTGISGSTVIGKRCMFAGQAGVVGHITICDDVVVGGATMISKDITRPGFYTGSFPGEEDRTWKRRVARFRRLDELTARVGALEKQARSDDDKD
jgi:UDP-3-O-[3-hydroxymyristoyl] glucosamine N-acyltransferase